MQLRIPAVFMRGGTSKGVFFRREDLPADPAERDRLLLRVIGSPDPYGKQIDGMGGATSSTSKVVILARSDRPDWPRTTHSRELSHTRKMPLLFISNSSSSRRF